MRYSHRNNLTGGAIIVVIILMITGIIWWNLNYKCVNEHYEWRTDCTVHRNSDGRRTGETCHERRVEVCDEWVAR